MLRILSLTLVAVIFATPYASDPPQKVMLGSDDLFAGIPGEGPLPVDEVKEWLADPALHQPLEVELPLGLSAGAANVWIPENNPLTRAKIELGRQLYFDPRLSADATISCASCHDPDQGFTTHTKFGVGVEGQTGNRNNPVSYNRILSREQFWDGRASSLEDQAVGPIANPIEMGSSHDACVLCLSNIPAYVVQFEKIFGGEITIEQVGKALASFERAIVTGPSPYDYYEPVARFKKAFAPEEGDLEALKEDNPAVYERYEDLKAAADEHPMSESATRGFELFFNKANCATCHAGANFTDEQYHNLGVGMDAEEPDLGRYVVTKEEKDKGAFKTPTLRNVTESAPYMHDGSQATLEEVMEWYNKGGHKNPWLSDKMKPLNLNKQELADLVAFMEALSGDFPKIERGRLPE